MSEPPPLVLRKLQRVYRGAPWSEEAEALGAAPPSLLRVARSHGVASIEAPAPEVTIFVVGDAGCGKSSFINGYAQELLLPEKQRLPPPLPPLRWVRSSDPGAGGGAGLPALLADGAAEFPKALGDASRCLGPTAASSRLHAVDIVEVSAHALADEELSKAIAWMAARGGLVLCLADSQRQPALSADVVGFLRRVLALAEPQCLQIALSKVDLVSRESDRIRLTAKVSRLLSDGLGRAFEVLPISRKDARRVLLEALEAAPREVSVAGVTFEVPPAVPEEGEDPLDAGTGRLMRAADALARQRLSDGLARLSADAAAARAAAAAQLAAVPPPGAAGVFGGAGGAGGGGGGIAALRSRLLQIGVAMALTAFLVPLVLDEDTDPDVVFLLRAGALGLGAVLFLFALCLSALPSPTPPSSSKSAALAAAVPGGGGGAAKVAAVDAKGEADAAAALDASPLAAALASGPEAVEALAAKLQEEIRFCDLAQRQRMVWSGKKATG